MRVLLASLAALAAAAVLAPAAGAVPLVSTDGTSLYQFDSATPAAATAAKPITGLQPGERIVDIDVRPATRQLYGIGATARMYTIDLATGAASLVGTPPGFGLNGGVFGIDFDPTADVLRLVSDNEQNTRLDPNTATITSSDTSLSNNGQVDSAAYTNNSAGAPTTTLFVIDPSNGFLSRLGGVGGTPSPNGGQLAFVGKLGLGGNVNASVGFDITASNAAFATLTTDATRLYSVDLATGAATALGDVGAGRAPMMGLAALRDGIALSAPDAAATEGQTVELSVNRLEPSSGAVTVVYLIAPGSASGDDYTASSGTLSWAAGDSAPKSISVPIADDTVEEPDEAFSVTLADPTGGAVLATPAASTITIAASDPTPLPTLTLGGKKKQKLRTVKRKGLVISATVSTTCDLAGSLKRGKRKIGQVRGSLVAGTSQVGVSVKKSARAKLRRGQKLKVTATCSNGAGKSKPATRTFKLGR